MKTEWLQNDHRQSVGLAEDLYLAGSCTLPMDWWVAWAVIGCPTNSPLIRVVRRHELTMTYQKK